MLAPARTRIEAAGLRSATLLKKKKLRFPVNFAKFLETSFLQNISMR